MQALQLPETPQREAPVGVSLSTPPHTKANEPPVYPVDLMAIVARNARTATCLCGTKATINPGSDSNKGGWTIATWQSHFSKTCSHADAVEYRRQKKAYDLKNLKGGNKKSSVMNWLKPKNRKPAYCNFAVGMPIVVSDLFDHDACYFLMRASHLCSLQLTT